MDGRVVSSDGSGPPPVDATATPKRGRAKKADGETPKKASAKKATNGNPSKKRKLSPPVEDAASGRDDTSVKEEGEEEVEPTDATS